MEGFTCQFCESVALEFIAFDDMTVKANNIQFLFRCLECLTEFSIFVEEENIGKQEYIIEEVKRIYSKRQKTEEGLIPRDVFDYRTGKIKRTFTEVNYHYG